MRLTLYTDYALRLLLALAAPRPERVTIADVARTYGIARNHLTKVAYDLSSQGLIKTTRGKGGGLALASPPEAINLGTVVRITEGDFALVPCFGHDPESCRILSACKLQHALHEARAAFMAVLDGYTLPDLATDDIGALLWRNSAGSNPIWPNPAVPGTG